MQCSACDVVDRNVNSIFVLVGVQQKVRIKTCNEKRILAGQQELTRTQIRCHKMLCQINGQRNQAGQTAEKIAGGATEMFNCCVTKDN